MTEYLRISYHLIPDYTIQRAFKLEGLDQMDPEASVTGTERRFSPKIRFRLFLPCLSHHFCCFAF